MAITPKQILDKIAAQRDNDQDEVKRLERQIDESLEKSSYFLASEGEFYSEGLDLQGGEINLLEMDN